MKRAQITVIELSLIALLFSSVVVYFTISTQISNSNYYSTNLESQLNSIIKISEYKKIIILENLSDSDLTQNWTPIHNQIQKSLTKYHLEISNISNSKTVISCNTTTGKIFSEQIISIENLTNYNYKIVKLGACY